MIFKKKTMFISLITSKVVKEFCRVTQFHVFFFIKVIMGRVLDLVI
jgi:hypothetical protein